jgi:peptidoglycan/LPS O-acetylase OafA/YrhL
MYVFRKKIPMHWLIATVSTVLLIASVQLKIFDQAFPWLAGYLFIYLALVPKSALTRFGKYGDFSYGIYIWAFPIQQVVAQYFLAKGVYFNALLSISIVLPVAILSWYFIEKPAMNYKRSRLSPDY